MKFPTPVQKGILVQRYKRFLADIELGGEVITAHCANPGSMMGLKEPGSTVWVTKAQNPKRKLGYDFQVVETDGTPVGINTSWPNKIVEEALSNQQIPELAGYGVTRREVKYGMNSRIDLLLEDNKKPSCYVEIKSITLSRKQGLAEFPDSPTARGTKHLQELAEIARAGQRAIMFYCIQRGDCQEFALARDIDPNYGAEFDKAVDAGLEIFAYDCNVTPHGITLRRPLKVVA